MLLFHQKMRFASLGAAKGYTKVGQAKNQRGFSSHCIANGTEQTEVNAAHWRRETERAGRSRAILIPTAARVKVSFVSDAGT
tara:strand:+ start:177 stop:422 length:246 start_codon:yes stop_codon:yes gene_type:complete